MSRTSYPPEVKQELYAYMWHDQHDRPMYGAPTFEEMGEADFKKMAGTLGGFSILLRHLAKTIGTQAMADVDELLRRTSLIRDKAVSRWLKSRR